MHTFQLLPTGWIAVVPVLALLLLGALIGAGVRFALKGDGTVEKPNRVAQLYGYTICLIAIVTILVSVSSLVHDMFALADPLQATRQDNRFGIDGTSGSLTSFEAYRATHGSRDVGARVGETRMMIPGAGGATSAPAGPSAPPDTMTTADQRARYEAFRADALARIHFTTMESLTTSLLVLAIAAVLFAVHWRWLRRLAAANGVSAPTTV